MSTMLLGYFYPPVTRKILRLLIGNFESRPASNLPAQFISIPETAGKITEECLFQRHNNVTIVRFKLTIIVAMSDARTHPTTFPTMFAMLTNKHTKRPRAAYAYYMLDVRICRLNELKSATCRYPLLSSIWHTW